MPIIRAPDPDDPPPWSHRMREPLGWALFVAAALLAVAGVTRLVAPGPEFPHATAVESDP